MPPSCELLERTAILKRALLEDLQGPRYRRELDAEIQDIFPAGSTVDESKFINLLDRLILKHTFSDGMTVVESYVRRHPELSETDRKMLLAWRDAREGVFRLDTVVDGGLALFNLVDELSYVAYSNTGTSYLERVESGMYLFARLVPLGDDWLFSGDTSLIPADHEDLAYDVALQMAQTMPRVVFQNPAKLEEGRALQREERQDFIEYFGSDLIVLRGKNVAPRMDAYMRWRMTEKRDEDGATVFERARASNKKTPKLSDLAFSRQFDEVDSVGIIYDELDGLNLFPDFGMLEEIFADPSLVEDDEHADVALAFLREQGLIPLPLRRMIDRYPDNADLLFQELLGDPTFSWKGKGEVLLRALKPDYYASPPLPSVTPISDSLLRYNRVYTSSRAVGRNDPCPCGSGRKFKHCHGRAKR